MPQDDQPEFELPPVLRLPQVPPLKVPARRQTQFIARPAPVRYTEEVPVTPPLAAENDLFVPVPVTPPLTHPPQAWMRTPNMVHRGELKTSILPSTPAASADAWGGRDESRPYSHMEGWGYGAASMPVRRFIPTGRRSRAVENGEFLLGCAFLIFMGLAALGLLVWLSSAR